MDFREFQKSKRNKRSEKKTNLDDVSFVLEGLDEEISKIKIEESEEIVEDFRPRFLGKLNESPNPLEYKDGTMYKDTRTGTVYIVENGLWESLVEDGKQGAQGRQGAAGSGTGRAEVVDVVNKELGISKNIGGNVECLGLFSDSRGILSVSNALQVSLVDRLSLSGLPTACVGSSTTEQYATTNRPTSAAQAATDGGFGNLQQKYCSPFTIVSGGFLGVAGVGTGPVAQVNSVVDQITQASLISGTLPTVLIYQPRGNDDISTDAGLAQSNYYIEWGIKNALKKGFKKIFLIKTHMILSKVNQIEQYIKSNLFLDSLEERYRGLVFIVDVWNVISPNGVPNISLLEETGVHLNAYGARVWATAWESPLYRAGILPNRFFPIDLDALPAEFTVFNSNSNFMGTNGLYSSAGWTGVAGWSTISQGQDDLWGRKTTRLTQIGNTAAYLRRTFTPTGSQCVARACASFLPIQNCGAVGFIIRNSTDSWNIKPMNVARGTVYPALENNKWIHYISDPFILPTAFFASNSQFNVSVIQGTDSSDLAICDVTSAGIVKIADSW